MTVAYPDWLPGVAWIHARYNARYGSRFSIGADVVTWTTGGFAWPWQWFGCLTGLPPDWALDFDADGRMQMTGVSEASITATDRLLAAFGYDTVPGEVLPSAMSHPSVCPSPLSIPLQNCDPPERVDREAERQFVLDTFSRGHGDVYGGSDVWRFRNIVLDRPALRALRVGYVTGRIMVSPWSAYGHYDGVAEAWVPGAAGFLEGQFLGFEAGGWDDPTTRLFWRCSLLLARPTSEE